MEKNGRDRKRQTRDEHMGKGQDRQVEVVHKGIMRQWLEEEK